MSGHATVSIAIDNKGQIKQADVKSSAKVFDNVSLRSAEKAHYRASCPVSEIVSEAERGEAVTHQLLFSSPNIFVIQAAPAGINVGTEPEGQFAIVSRSAGIHGITDLTRGAFTHEGEQIAGIFASPEGPVSFLDQQHLLCRFSQTYARTEATSHRLMRRFTLIHQGNGSGKIEFSLPYQERIGIGTNPYDTEREDIDLFAMIAAGLRMEQFSLNYTQT